MRMVLLGFVMLSAGCGQAMHSVKADRAPTLALPDAWSSASTTTQATAAQWWRALGDPNLDALCALALTANLELSRARTRILAAEAIAHATDAAIWPQVQIEASVARQRQNLFLGQAVSFHVTSFPLTVSASYEVDLWGRVAAARAAAELDVRASREDLEAAAISISGAVADAWYALVAERATMRLIDAQQALGQKLLDLVEFRFGRGIVGAVDVMQQKSQVEAVRAQRPAIAMRMRLAEQRLAVLLGKSPGFRLALAETSELPALAATPTAGVPAAVLAARPDIRAAQQRMLAVDHRLGAAKADLLPAIRLSASSGFQGRAGATGGAVFFDNWVWNLVANLTAPLWDGGRRRAEIERVRAGLVDAVGAYTIVVQRAFSEVEEALVREAGARASLAAVDVRIDLAGHILDEVRFRYTRGSTDYLPVLSTLSSLQALEQERLVHQRAVLTARLGLLRALGGAPLASAAASAGRNDVVHDSVDGAANAAANNGAPTATPSPEGP